MEKMHRARYTLEYKLEALRLIGAGQYERRYANTHPVSTQVEITGRSKSDDWSASEGRTRQADSGGGTKKMQRANAVNYFYSASK